MQNCKNKIEHFFESNPAVVQNYPGLNLSFLLDSFCHFFELSPLDPTPENSDIFLDQLKEGRPIQYILKNAFFYRSDFYVDERVLIPRSETEILVERAASFLNQLKTTNCNVCEIGVGSFCLGLSLLLDSQKSVNFIGGDISKEALEVASINLEKHKDELQNHDIKLILSDRFKSIHGEYDLIVSNPPYIKAKADRDGVHSQVLAFEPHLALFLKDDEFFIWFDDFFKEIHLQLKQYGKAFIEGHEDNLSDLAKMAKKYFNKVEIINDYTQRKRFIELSDRKELKQNG